MSELELAIAGLLTLLGAGAILYAGIARSKGRVLADADPTPASPASGKDEGA